MQKPLYGLLKILLLSTSVQSFLRCQAVPRYSSRADPTFHNKNTELCSENIQTELLIDQEIEKKIKGIRAIASDVDGTLLGTDHLLSDKTKQVILRVVEEISKPGGKVQYFFPATGKSRKGALDSLGPEVRDLLSVLPGVFIQGLYCVDGNGTVVYECNLPTQAIQAAEAIAKKFNITVIGNFRDEIYCNPAGDPSVLAEVNGKWGEPEPIMISSLSEKGPKFNKLVFSGTQDDVDMLCDRMRPELEILAKENGATVTTSYPTMLELLPAGCSKAEGVRQLCKHLGVDPTLELLALGDQENDKGMLEMAAIGVAVGNGSPIAKLAADYVMECSSNEGAAGLAMERFSRLIESSQ